MDVATWVFGACGALGGASGAAAFLHSRRMDARREEAAALAAARAETTEHQEIRALAERARETAADLKPRMDQVAEGLERAREEVHQNSAKIGVLESKMDVFWRNVALDVAQVLHRPHEEWRDLDRLLDRFRDDTITGAEMTQLTGLLHELKEGTFSSLIPVTQADQIAASLLLRAIEQTRGAGTDAGGGQDTAAGSR